jgi:PTS system fructose-specific IIA component/PTS system nitrogen regulatory IIA component
MKLTEVFQPENILPDLAATRKEEAIPEMVNQLCATGTLPKAQATNVEKAMLRREELGSTGIGKGVAVPHAKVPGVKGVIGAFARSKTGVEFNSLDGQPVFLIFMLVSAPDTVEPHLEALRKITALLKLEDICSFLRRAKDRAEMISLLAEADEILSK